MNRCASPELFDKTVDLINHFKNYFTSTTKTIYENPSPGNKKGGISNPGGQVLRVYPEIGEALL